MSFGYKVNNQQLEEVLNEVTGKKKLVFAAASNEGNRAEQASFPARLERVFCINSINGNGKWSDTNPPDDAQAVNFGTLGENVIGAWPCALDHPKKQTDHTGTVVAESGSSVATAIAAATAASLLEFVAQTPRGAKSVTTLTRSKLDACTERLRSHEGLKVVFSDGAMIDGNQSRRTIAPWGVLGGSDTSLDRRDRLSHIYHLLHQKYGRGLGMDME